VVVNLTKLPAPAPVRLSLSNAYQAKLLGGWQEDPSQKSAVALLNQLLTALQTPSTRPPRGLYLHGPVGRGKSQLLGLFMRHVEHLKSRRTHMHAFMGEIHQRLFEIKSGDPIQQTARQLADECKVFGFDEFYITNIADAILLGRLFEHLFKYGVVIVTTSNWPMDDLYQNGRNRKSFLPFLRLLKQHLQPVDLGDGLDYRQPEEPHWPLYLLTSPDRPATDQLALLFERYANGRPSQLPDGFEATIVSGSCAWFQFSEICERPLGRLEYLKLVRHTETLVIENVPAFTADDSEAALRLVTLIDICYEHHRRVIISASAYPEDLYPAGPVTEAFRRTASRLMEMQTWTAHA
jgi:cell division protein ZapE